MTDSADLDLAVALADAADAISFTRFLRADLQVETKPDLTPVSDADRSIEEVLRRILAQERPKDGVLGEEYGELPAASGTRRWVIDPIDGTKSFVRGVPVWATLIALEEANGDEVHSRVGMVSAPALGRRWWAMRGGGAWTTFTDGNPRPIKASSVARLEDASFSYSSLSGWEAGGRRDSFLALTDAVWRTRAYGDFWSHMLVAEGCVDLAAEPELSRWDMAALQVIVEEAGGRFTDLAGRRGSGGGSLLASNGLLHDEALAFLGG